MNSMGDANNRRSLSKASEKVKKLPSLWPSSLSASAALLALGAMVMLQPAAAARISTEEYGSTDGDDSAKSFWTTLIEALGWNELPMWAMDPTDSCWNDEVQAALLGDASDWHPTNGYAREPSCRAMENKVPDILSSEGTRSSMIGVMKFCAFAIATLSLVLVFKRYPRLRNRPAVV